MSAGVDVGVRSCGDSKYDKWLAPWFEVKKIVSHSGGSHTALEVFGVLAAALGRHTKGARAAGRDSSIQDQWKAIRKLTHPYMEDQRYSVLYQ